MELSYPREGTGACNSCGFCSMSVLKLVKKKKIQAFLWKNNIIPSLQHTTYVRMEYKNYYNTYPRDVYLSEILLSIHFQCFNTQYRL